jgi:hypothetical protein
MHQSIQTKSTKVSKNISIILNSEPFSSERKKQKDREDAWAKLESMAAQNASRMPISKPYSRDVSIPIPKRMF